ncbi:MAG: hypothetical protein RR253_07440, partial [Oscillospiraceae bacterium]
RVQGWYNLKEYLHPFKDYEGKLRSKLTIFSNCLNLIRTLPTLQHDKHDPNDVAGEPHELTHAPDALRYFVAGRPLNSKLPIAKDEDILTFDDQLDNFFDFKI